MDQKKIGAFIASRRRALGLTQAQLGERLGVTDKSVSKWERGVCLPDVSLYQPLCALLGISLNDFFAGETVAPEQTAQKAEEAMIGIARVGDDRRRRLSRIVATLAAVSLILALLTVAAAMALRERGFGRTNYVRPYNLSDRERQVSQMVSDSVGTRLYEFAADARYRSVEITVTTCDREGREMAPPSILHEELLGSGRHTGLISVSFTGLEEMKPAIRYAVAQTDSMAASVTALPTEPAVYTMGYQTIISGLDRLEHFADGAPITIAVYAVSGGEALTLPDLNDSPEDWQSLGCEWMVRLELKFL